jgi:periplasmic protein TonB
MMKETQHFPDLNELAYKGRNQEYGSYFLRRKYSRYLLLSLLLGTFLYLAMFLIPLILYYVENSDLNINPDIMYSVEYDFIQSPENEPNAMPSLPIAEPETPLPPVIADSLEDKKEKKEIKPVEEEKTESKQDSTAEGKGQSTHGTGSGDDTGIYTTIDVYPKYPGGDASRLTFLRTNIRYPEIAQKSGLQGVVMVIFVVETDGSVSNVQVSKGIGAGCDEEAMRVTRMMPRWEPGRRSGKPVRVMVRMPIVFKIPGRS